METIDFFERHELLPKKVQRIINNTGEAEGYKGCDKLLKKLQSIGWTFEYGLDASPYDLRPMMDELYSAQCHRRNLPLIEGERSRNGSGNQIDFELPISGKNAVWGEIEYNERLKRYEHLAQDSDGKLYRVISK